MTATLAPPTLDRRIAPRHQPAFGTVCRLGREIGLVRDISRSGLSMLLGKPPEPGAELHVVLAMDGETAGLAVQIRVVHVREVATGDYLLGARFGRPLDADEMRPFVGQEP